MLSQFSDPEFALPNHMMAFAIAHAEQELVNEVQQAYHMIPIEFMERNGVGLDGFKMGVSYYQCTTLV